MPYPAADLTQIHTYPIRQRSSLVATKNLVLPSQPPPVFHHPELDELADRIAKSHQHGHQVILMIGGHVIKCGLAPVLIEMMKLGIITHIASNGSATIHDFEIAMNGSTSEDVATSLEDGSFGMAEETGAWMNQAIQRGMRDGLGMGEALGRLIAEDDAFQHRQYSLLYHAYSLHIPYTVHVAIGTDIIHQHPLCDFSAIGAASGQDFKIFVHSVTQMECGVFCNFGSSVIGPEVFLKSLSIARNLGFPVKNITTANFDLVPLTGDYRQPAKKDQPEYYYRPKKNIVIRPNSLGGRGFHINGDHRETIPNLYYLIKGKLAEGEQTASIKTSEGDDKISAINNQPEHYYLREYFTSKSKLALDLFQSLPSVEKAVHMLVNCFRNGGTLFLCGNGGSFSDALHIAGELNKSFKLPRPLPQATRERLDQLSNGVELSKTLQQGLRTIVLGTNPSLLSAIDNDTSQRYLYYSQELISLARPGDVLFGISTSGKAQNIHHAMVTARAWGLKTIALTGLSKNPLEQMADVIIKSPGQDTASIQEQHIRIYHAICEVLEQIFFGEGIEK